MKKMKFMLFAVAAIAAASCAKEIAPETPQNGTEGLIPMTFTAGTDNVESKVALQENGVTLHWESSDQISVFDGTANNKFTTTGSGASADFTGTVNPAATEFYALYPYQEDASFGLDESAENRATIYAEVPAVQTAVAGSVPSDAFVAVAKSDNSNNFAFTTICGYIKYTLNQDNVQSITFSGNNNESITGKVKIYFNEDGTANQTYVSGAMKPTVTLTGDLQNGKTYYAAIRPTSFTKGLTVSILYKDGTRSYMTTGVAPAEGVKANVVMNFVAPSAYETTAPSDNFLAYIHGYDLGFPAGATYDEAVLLEASAADGSSKLLSNLKGNKNRVIFLTAAEGSNFSIESVAGMDKDIAVIGRNNDAMPTIKVSNYFRNKHGSFFMKNVIIDASGLASANISYVFNHSNATADYGEIIIDGCWFKKLGKAIWQNAGALQYSVKKFTFKNNKVEITANDVALFNFYRPVTKADIHVENNVFYAAANINGETVEEVDRTGFKVVSHTAAADVSVGLELDKIVLNNNTFVNVYFNKQGYINANKINFAEVKSNLISVPNYVSIVGTNYWGILFANGRKTVTSAGTTYDTFVQYADMSATETQTVTAKEGTNPDYYPAEGSITVLYNTAYRIRPDANDRYPKAGYLDLKLREGVFCSKGSFYTNVANPSSVNEEVFATTDFVNGIFTQKETYANKGAVITE